MSKSQGYVSQEDSQKQGKKWLELLKAHGVTDTSFIGWGAISSFLMPINGRQQKVEIKADLDDLLKMYKLTPLRFADNLGFAINRLIYSRLALALQNWIQLSNELPIKGDELHLRIANDEEGSEEGEEHFSETIEVTFRVRRRRLTSGRYILQGESPLPYWQFEFDLIDSDIKEWIEENWYGNYMDDSPPDLSKPNQ